MLLVALAFAAPPPPPIINGQSADDTVYPATGATIVDAVLDYGGGYAYKSVFCSSTLIAPDVVLLAGHCVDETSLTMGYYDLKKFDMGWTRQADLTAWDGTTYNEDWPDDVIMATAWVKHERFSLYDLQTGIAENFDIALLFLEEAVTDVEPAVVITAEEASQIAQGDAVDVVGWGQQVATSYGQTPPKGTYGVKYWGTSVIGEIGIPEFQVGPEKSDVRKCHGDSGGPTFMQVETESPETTRIIGVTSHAYDNSDCDHAGGVDTRVDHYLEWIDSTMRAACDDGTRVWCDEPGILPPPEPVVDPPGDTGLADGKGDADGDDDETGGCGCNSGATSAMALPWVGMLLLRRRR